MPGRPPSAFLGNYKFNARPVVTHSPDCVVYLNGALELPSCRECSKTIDLNRYVQNVSVDMSVDSPPGSASITLVVPSQVGQDLYFDGNLILTTMMEVEIHMKGYFTVDGIPRYYPVFWGLITNVEDTFSGGEYTINISCSDILHWWQSQHININPAYKHFGGHPGSGWQMFGHKFAGKNPYDIIYMLSRHVFGDIYQAARSLTGYNAQEKQISRSALLQTMLYWEKRFQRMTKALVLYGIDGNVVRGIDIGTRYQIRGNSVVDLQNSTNKRRAAKRQGGFASTIVWQTGKNPPQGKKLFDPASSMVAAFQTQFANAGNIEFWESEYLTKLEVAQQCAQSIGFEFYMDVTGEIVFKPPFWNLDCRANFPVSWIRDIDIIDWSFSESEADVVNHLILKGSWRGKISYGMGSEVQPTTSITDYRLLRKYGWRTQDYHCDYWSNPRTLFLHGLNVMDHQNVNIHQGSITIPIRPELRMGFPVFVEPKDTFWYIKGINHSYTRGGRCTTGLTLNAKRSKFFAPKNLAQRDKARDRRKGGRVTFRAYTSVQPSTDDQDAIKQGLRGNWLDEPFFIRDANGKLIGRPNVVMVFDKAWSEMTMRQQAQALGLDPKRFGGKGAKKKLDKAIRQKIRESFGAGLSKKITFEEWLSQQTIGRTGYGLFTGGQYQFAEDPEIQETIYIGRGSRQKERAVPVERFVTDDSGKTVTQKKSVKVASSGQAVFPVSDDAGFEVIGNYRYGRGLMVVPTGELQRRPKSGVSNKDGQDQRNPDSLKATLDKGFSLGTGLNPGLISAETLVKMRPGDTATKTANEVNAATGDVKGEPQKAIAEARGGAKATTPVEYTKTDPFVIRLDGSEKARALAEMSPSFADPFLGSSSSNCACSIHRADVYINLAESGGIFGFMRDYLKPVTKPKYRTIKTTSTEPVNARYSADDLLGYATRQGRRNKDGSWKYRPTKQIPENLQNNARKTVAAMEVLHDYWSQAATQTGSDGRPRVKIDVSPNGGHSTGGHVNGSAHYKAQAMDLVVRVDGKRVSNARIYLGLIKLINDGKLPDGGVGYYTSRGAFNATGGSITAGTGKYATTSMPHYDWGRTRKWLWIGSGDGRTKSRPGKTVQDLLNSDQLPFNVANELNDSSLPGTDGVRSWNEYLSNEGGYRTITKEVQQEIDGEEVIGYTLPHGVLDRGVIMRRIEENLFKLNEDRDKAHELYEKQVRGDQNLLGLSAAGEQALLQFFRFSADPEPPRTPPSLPALPPRVKTLNSASFLSTLGVSLPNGVDGAALNEAYLLKIDRISELAALRERISSGNVNSNELQQLNNQMLQLQDEIKTSVAADYFASTGETPSANDTRFMEEAIGALLRQTSTDAIASATTSGG